MVGAFVVWVQTTHIAIVFGEEKTLRQYRISIQRFELIRPQNFMLRFYLEGAGLRDDGLCLSCRLQILPRPVVAKRELRHDGERRRLRSSIVRRDTYQH